ncbi:hypothetical protein HJC23_000635 [Cyclotella cryptica]|uniref:GH18 domain-containing protein n=1 Tax=Cyclotella cryptica TaxID=29204 RepID=A0ABD3Q7U3_9STRA
MMMRLSILCLLFLLKTNETSAHGFLTTPRSRNLVAYEDRVYYPQTENDPLPEDCPSYLNRGGVLARCGMVEQRNYDLPLNALGQPLRPNPQQVYTESSLINITITLTAHHKGHFVFSACPIANTTTSPTQECFDAHPLNFVEDLLYGAPVDTNHPSRVYVAPSTIANRVNSNREEFIDAMLFQYTLQLPQGLVGDLVLLQWYYVASNSGCIHEGYESYPFPRAWIGSSSDQEENGEPSAWEEKWSVGTGLKSCDEVLSEDGDGIPEQFWNCAEITIQPKLEPLASNLAAQLIPSNRHSKTIIGYYASWQWYDRDKLASPTNMDFSKISRVNFGFFQTDEAGNIWGTDSWADPNLLFGPYNWNPSPNETEYCSWDTPTEKVCKTHFYEEGLIHLVHAAGAEIYPSLGGWSLSDPFPAMSANQESRLNFANKCIQLVEEYDFDGIDVDWEYPGYTDHSGTPEDTQSYNLLLQILREKLDELGARNNRFYGLAAALPCGPANIKNIDIETAVKYLTELNLMTYDFFGAWSPTTGVNAPLYDQDWGGKDSKDLSVDGCVRNWINGGGSPSAINIGLPFYGRSFLKAKGLNENHEGNDKNNWFWDDGSPQL